MNARNYFAALLASLTPEAQKCDVGLYVRECGGAFVNNFHEGRTLNVRERLQWLAGKMNERRLGRWESVTLAGLFPDDMAIIQSAIDRK
jgi:hypothetical protein